MLTAFIVLIVFSLLIFVHELGHFLAARRAGVRVEEFGFGLPPRIWGRKWKGTLWSLNWIPIGGFVRMHGEADLEGKLSNKKNSYSSKGKLDRFTILIAGVAMNFLLAILIFTIGYSVGMTPIQGSREFVQQYESQTPMVMIEQVFPDTPAELAGIQTGDIYISIDGQEVHRASEILDLIASGETADYTIQRGEDVLSFSLAPDPTTTRIGVSLREQIQIDPVSLPLVGAFQASLRETWRLSVLTVRGFGSFLAQLVTTAQIPAGVAGPVGIVTIIADAADYGLIPLLKLIAMLSISLGVLNVFPIPMLDGGKILFIIWELVSGGRKVNAQIENYVHLAGFLFLIGLMIVVTWNDLAKLLFG